MRGGVVEADEPRGGAREEEEAMGRKMNYHVADVTDRGMLPQSAGGGSVEAWKWAR